MTGVDPYRPTSRPGWQSDPPPSRPYGPPPAGPTFGPATPGPPGRRPRTRLIVAAVLALPFLELTGMILVGRALGVLALSGLLIAGAVAGTLVLRRVRESAARRFDPHRTVLDPAPAPGLPPGPEAPARTVLLALAGILLILPGFLSDAVGLVLLAPPVRRAVSALLGEALLRRLGTRTARIVPGEVIDGDVTGPL